MFESKLGTERERDLHKIEGARLKATPGQRVEEKIIIQKKRKDLPTGRNLVCRNLIGRELSDNPNREKSPDEAVKGLTNEGKKMITQFIHENKKVENNIEKEKHKNQYISMNSPESTTSFSFEASKKEKQKSTNEDSNQNNKININENDNKNQIKISWNKNQ